MPAEYRTKDKMLPNAVTNDVLKLGPEVDPPRQLGHDPTVGLAANQPSNRSHGESGNITTQHQQALRFLNKERGSREDFHKHLACTVGKMEEVKVIFTLQDPLHIPLDHLFLGPALHILRPESRHHGHKVGGITNPLRCSPSFLSSSS